MVDHDQRAPEAVELRQVLRAVNTEWAGVIRRAAAASHALADIAQATDIAAPSLYFRLRQVAPNR